MEIDCGGCSLDQVRQDIETAETDAQIQYVIFDFRSPGGTVTGVPEIADEIKALGLSKETVAFTDDQCCSAALWLASQCNQFFCSPSATVGSVGVYSVYADESVSLSQQGIKINEIASGKYKLSGAPWRAMTDTERAMFQSSCDAIYANFKAAILDNRDVADEDMQGQCFNGADALEKGLVDGLAPSLEDLLDYLTAD
jgi:signal peptide peptidase SppA